MGLTEKKKRFSLVIIVRSTEISQPFGYSVVKGTVETDCCRKKGPVIRNKRLYVSIWTFRGGDLRHRWCGVRDKMDADFAHL